MSDEMPEPRTITPFKLINRGEDTLDENENVVFADFSPRVIPSETPDEVEDILPKAESAPEPVPSSESTQTEGQETSETPVQAPVEEDAGSLSLNETSSQSSSSGPRNG